MRQKTILALLMLVGIGVCTFKFLKLRRTPFIFETQLLNFNPDEVLAFEVRFPDGEELVFNQESSYWMVTDGRRGVRIPTDSIVQMLSPLHTRTNLDLLDEDSGDYTQLGLTDKTGIRVRLLGIQGTLEDFFIGRTDRHRAFFRLSDQQEVYLVDTISIRHFYRRLSSYMQVPFFSLPASTPIERVVYETYRDSMRVVFQNLNGIWALDSVKLSPEDSVQWLDYLNCISTLPAGLFAEDFDELSADNKLERKLVFGLQQGDSLRVVCYAPEGKGFPFVLHSSARPADFFASDSTGLFFTLFTRLDRMVYPILLQKTNP